MSLDEICGTVPSHKNDITSLLASPDGKYLMSADTGNLAKCWSFDRQTFTGDCAVTYSDSVGVGMINGIPVFAYSDRHSQIIYSKLPILDSPEMDSLPIQYSNHFVIDSDETGTAKSNCFRIRIINGRKKTSLRIQEKACRSRISGFSITNNVCSSISDGEVPRIMRLLLWICETVK